MIKYIASDLDGTLLHNGAQQLPEEIFDLIRALKSRGIHFIAASGRQYYNMYRMFEPVQNDISYIAENGSLCIHNHEIISRGVIDRTSVFESLKLHDNMIPAIVSYPAKITATQIQKTSILFLTY